MKKFIAVFLILFAANYNSLFAQFEPDMTSQGLRFDGVYMASMQDDYTSNSLQLYVRFFEDGTVATAATSDSPVKVLEWLFPGNNAPMALGTFGYKPKNGKLKFGTTSAGGQVKYKGVVSNTGELLMDVKSKINRTKFQKVFQFIPKSNAFNTQPSNNYIDGATPYRPSTTTRVRVKTAN
ncbi:MAG: hypothetical protein R3E32_03480 [Chitinophagales bacterium]